MDAQLKAMTDALERHYHQVAMTSMADVPLINPELRVQAVGFRASEHGWLGVLITPWFISLVLLPVDKAWQELSVGSHQGHVFASGRYDFLITEADGIGHYKSCSLLSPVLEVPDQETAVQVALAALHAVNKEQFRDSSSMPPALGALGKQTHDKQSPGPKPELTRKPISRRDFFRGRFLADDSASKT